MFGPSVGVCALIVAVCPAPLPLVVLVGGFLAIEHVQSAEEQQKERERRMSSSL